MNELIAALGEFSLLSEDAVHGANRAEVLALVQQGIVAGAAPVAARPESFPFEQAQFGNQAVGLIKGLEQGPISRAGLHREHLQNGFPLQNPLGRGILGRFQASMCPALFSRRPGGGVNLPLDTRCLNTEDRVTF